VENIARLRADCEKYGMPLMIEPLVMAPADGGKSAYAVDGDATKIVTPARLAREFGSRHHQGRSHSRSRRFP